MRKPRPIKVNAGVRDNYIELKYVGGDLPYILVNVVNPDAYGYIEDRDVKRLHKWCEECLKAMPKKRRSKR